MSKSESNNSGRNKIEGGGRTMGKSRSDGWKKSDDKESKGGVKRGAAKSSRGDAKKPAAKSAGGDWKKSDPKSARGDWKKSDPKSARGDWKKADPKSSRGDLKKSATKAKPGDDLVRLNKYIAASGICSRREADQLISAGLVSVNGKVISELGTKVKPEDDVRYNGERLRNEKKVYLLLNKPKDYVTTTDDPRERKTVMTLIHHACPERIYPVGRLDRNTTGVLLFTNDGEMAKRLTHPGYNKKKIYHVFLDKGVSGGDLKKLADGVELEDGFIQPDAISYVSNESRKEIGLEIHSGRNRIVRRMFESLGYRVTKLDRVYFAGLTKKNVQRGKWRFLTEKEVNRLKMNAYE